MQKLDNFVKENIPNNLSRMVPVIEKEIIQYDVFNALESLGLIDKLVFQGGTCLRLCYGAERRSEDLDFTFDGELNDLDLAGIQAYLEATLGKTFGLEVRVKPPNKIVEFSHAQMKRWWLVVDTVPARVDLPSQKLKIKIVSVATLTKEVHRIARNYEFLSQSVGLTLAVCESREEIMADKLVAFVNTKDDHIRKRDLWDLIYLISDGKTDVEAAVDMVEFKRKTYGCELTNTEFSKRGIKRANEVGKSQAFSKDMARFLPRESFNALFGSEMKREFGISEVCGLYRRAGV